MLFALREPYAPRPIRPIGAWGVGSWRLKAYSIAYGRPLADSALIDAARDRVSRYLADLRERHTTYGVGFVGIHDGRGENQVFLSRWAGENELLHATWISGNDRPAELRDSPPDQNVACVWDLAVMCFERQAWVNEVLRNPGSDALDRYLARSIDAEV